MTQDPVTLTRAARILIVDDAAIIRRTLSSVVEADPDLTVAATAGTGVMALRMIPQVAPDLVVLDIEMPGLDGIAVLREIRRGFGSLPVVMFSSRSPRSTAHTVEALAAGATDFVLKPCGAGDRQSAIEHVRTQLIVKVKRILAGAVAGREPLPLPREQWQPAKPKQISSVRVDAVAIGCSTGGPNALAELLPTLPAGLPVPILIVQHMPPGFTRSLAQRLDATCHLDVAEGVDGAPMRPGDVWIAPGDRHMAVHRAGGGCELRLDSGAMVNSCRPAVDVLFRSLAAALGPRVLGIVLTGMGQDGLNGCRSIVDAGGQVLTQDRESSVVWGMPRAVLEAGVSQVSLPISCLGEEIVARVAIGRSEPLESDRR